MFEGDDRELVTLINELEIDPIEAINSCRDKYLKIDSGHKQWICTTIAFIVAFTRDLTNDNARRSRFVGDRFWGKTPPRQINLHVMAARYILGAKSPRGSLYVRSHSYATVAKHFIDRDVNPNQVRELMKETTLDALLRGDVEIADLDSNGSLEDQTTGAIVKARKFTKGVVNRRPGLADQKSTNRTSESMQNKVPEIGIRQLSNSHRVDGSRPALQFKNYPFNVDDEAAIRFGACRETFLNRQIADKFVIEVTRQTDSDGFRRYIMLSVRPRPS